MFGVSASTVFSAVAPTVIGGLLGGSKGSGGSSQQTQNKTIDPRMDPYVYGGNGVLANAQDWFNKNKSGLNDQMLQGLNSQWNQYNSTKPAFDQMQNIGMGLLGAGVAGNPFTSGQASLNAGIPMPRFQMPQQMQQAPQVAAPVQQMQPPMQPPMQPQGHAVNGMGLNVYNQPMGVSNGPFSMPQQAPQAQPVQAPQQPQIPMDDYQRYLQLGIQPFSGGAF